MPSLRLLALFFVSGACGLIYQVVWMRALTLTLSVSVYAATTVLCAFMAGLALGAALASRLVDRLARPLVVFGAVEIGVGIAGLVSLAVLFELGPAYAWLHRILGGEGISFILARFGLACAVLLLPATLMGMTLPLLSRAVIDRTDVAGRGAGGLYAANTLGAVAGCLAAGFWLIASFGLRATTAVAAILNFAVGASAVILGRRAAAASPATASNEAPAETRAPRAVLLAMIGFGVSGFTAIGYEVLWTRSLEQFTHNSTYAYTAMLATFLIGIGAGSALTARRADRSSHPLATFGFLQLGVGVSVIAALLVYARLLDWIPVVAASMGGITTWPRAVALVFSVAATILLLTTFCFGAQFPFVVRAVVDSVRVAGRRIGLAYSLNTLGSIGGAITVGFFLLPAIGIRGAFGILITLNLVVGAFLVWSGSPRKVGATAGVIAFAGLAAMQFLVPAEPFRDVFLRRYGKLLLYREQVTDIVMVTEDDKGDRVIRFGDGRGTAGTQTVREDRSYAHLAMLHHPAPKRILNICFGVGNSLSAVTQYPVERVDQVELSPGVVHAAPHFSKTNRDVLSDPRVHLTIQDGRNFLLASQDLYDIIRLDPPELHTAGIVNLYTEEFFELAREHLAPGGIFSIWVNIAYTPEAEMKMILRTMEEVFPHVTVWHGPWLYSWVINGSVDPSGPDLALLKHWFADPKVRADLKSIPFQNPVDVLSHFVMADDEVRDWSKDAPIITDDHTRLDFSVPRSADSYFGIANSQTDYYLADLMTPDSTPLRRAVRYCAHKQPVYPHLRHAEDSGVLPDDLRARIDSEQRSMPGGGCLGVAGTQEPSVSG